MYRRTKQSADDEPAVQPIARACLHHQVIRLSAGIEFVHSLVESIPALQPLMAEHLADQRTLLTHVFMGDVAQYAINQSANPEAAQDLEKLLGILDEGLRGGSEEVEELILASFVENLMGESEAVARLKLSMKPTLAQRVTDICG